MALVSDLTESWASHNAFLARLVGSRLVNVAWLASLGKEGLCACFLPAIKQRRVFYVAVRFEQDRAARDSASPSSIQGKSALCLEVGNPSI